MRLEPVSVDRQCLRAFVFDADRIHGAAANSMAVRIGASKANDTLDMDGPLTLRCAKHYLLAISLRWKLR
jgi:hypothetical protein